MQSPPCLLFARLPSLHSLHPLPTLLPAPLLRHGFPPSPPLLPRQVFTWAVLRPPPGPMNLIFHATCPGAAIQSALLGPRTPPSPISPPASAISRPLHQGALPASQCPFPQGLVLGLVSGASPDLLPDLMIFSFLQSFLPSPALMPHSN